MQTLLSEIARVLRGLTNEIQDGKVSAVDAVARISSLSTAIEKWAATVNGRSAEEKLDFLIFMQSKRTKSSGKEVILSGETLFQEWRKAKQKAEQSTTKQPLKPIPSEDVDLPPNKTAQ